MRILTKIYEISSEPKINVQNQDTGIIQAAQRIKHRFLYESELQPLITAIQMNEYVSSKLNIPNTDVISQILMNHD